MSIKTRNKKTSGIDLDKIVEELLSSIKERPRSIVKERFGLDGKDPKVLDQIGKQFGVTRERIRQIESDSFKKLREADKSQAFTSIIEKAKKTIEESGGFCEKRKLKEGIKNNLSKTERNQLMFILNSSDQISFKKGNLKLNGFWFLDGSEVDKKISQAHRFIIKYLQKEKRPMSFDEIHDYLRSSQWEKLFCDRTGEKRLEMILYSSRVIDKNILYEYGLNNWKIISERGSREKAYLILRKNEKPLHFREITKKINEHWEDKEALPQTVHNELIKDNRFVLVGRGIYGLENWGFPRGTVKEIIIDYMKEKDGPVEKEVIVEYVLSKKQVKETTVLVTLANRVSFDKTVDGQFVLR